MPAVEDGQPQSRKARNQGNRWLDSYPLNVQALHDQRGDAAYFTLTFLSVPYFYKEDVPIYFSGAIRDDLPMVFFRQGVEYLVTKGLFSFLGRRKSHDSLFDVLIPTFNVCERMMQNIVLNFPVDMITSYKIEDKSKKFICKCIF